MVDMTLPALRALLSEKEREAESALAAAVFDLVKTSAVSIETAERVMQTVLDMLDELAGADLSVKYLDPKNPRNTWTGRGRLPNWLRDAELRGSNREDFRVTKFNPRSNRV